VLVGAFFLKAAVVPFRVGADGRSASVPVTAYMATTSRPRCCSPPSACSRWPRRRTACRFDRDAAFGVDRVGTCRYADEPGA
jgi:hypothetical protein